MSNPKLEYQAYVRTTPGKLWDAITSPEQTRQYFYGLAVTSDWKPGASIKHLFPDGKSQVEGKVIEVEPGRKIVHTFATTGSTDGASRVTWEIQPMGAVTLLTLTHVGPGIRQRGSNGQRVDRSPAPFRHFTQRLRARLQVPIR